MTAYRVLVTPIAEASIVDAFHFIRSQSPIDAERWLLSLYDAIDTLSQFPDRCSSAPESVYFDDALHHLLYGSHRIIFRIEDANAVVRVLYLRHMAQRVVGEPIPDTVETTEGT